MADAIPVIDVADHLAGRSGALQALARQFHDALTTVGFMVITGHDVPQPLIAQTFAEAQRLHDLPMPEKLVLKLNEHNNGYMAMSRYAVWTFRGQPEHQAGPERSLLHQTRTRTG